MVRSGFLSAAAGARYQAGPEGVAARANDALPSDLTVGIARPAGHVFDRTSPRAPVTSESFSRQFAPQ